MQQQPLPLNCAADVPSTRPAAQVDTPEPWSHAAWFPLGVFLFTQLLSAVWMLHLSGETHDTYPQFVSRWDGAYYLDIARHGYTTDILRGGHLADRNWAFYPLYPLTVGALAKVTTLDAAVIAPAVSLICGAAAVVLLHRAVGKRLGEHAARTVTLLVSTAVASPVMQMAYAEAMALLLLVLALEAVMSRRYRTMLALAALLALTRPVGLPFAAIVGVHLLANRGNQNRVWALVVLSCTGVTMALWPLIAAIATGIPDVYLRTMALWEVPGVGRSWFTQCADRPVGWVLIVAALTLPLWVAFRFMPAGVPLEWKAWMVAYPAYLLFTAYPSSSTVRYLLLAFPFALAFARPTLPGWLPRVLAGAGLIGNFLWVQNFVASWTEIFP